MALISRPGHPSAVARLQLGLEAGPSPRCALRWPAARRLVLKGTPQRGAAHVVGAAHPGLAQGIQLHEAKSEAELRAAAYLRAASFYSYPKDRSPMAARSHRRMKADSAWDELSNKIRGKDPAYKALTVRCFVATVAEDPSSELVQQVLADEDFDASSKLPSPGPGQPAYLVLGSLDLNIGAVLPAEELVGKLPRLEADAGPSSSSSSALGSGAGAGGGPASPHKFGAQRAYLSNVCVAKGARRRGVAQALMVRAEEEARAAGVRHLYVHVVHSNEAAVQLYRDTLGFEVESEESEGTARVLGRLRRLLLGKPL